MIRDLGYHAGLLSLAALREAGDQALLDHCRAVGQVTPLVGFYLQPAVGGRVLSYRFWRQFAEIDNVVAVKIAPFNRYQTLDVVRAVAESGRDDIALYTGNDDNIVLDLLTPYRFPLGGRTRRAPHCPAACWATGRCGPAGPSSCCDECHRLAAAGGGVPGRDALPRRGSHRLQRGLLRRGPRLCRLHRRHPRGPAPAGAAGGHLVPRPPPGAQPRPARKRSTASTPPTPT